MKQDWKVPTTFQTNGGLAIDTCNTSPGSYPDVFSSNNFKFNQRVWNTKTFNQRRWATNNDFGNFDGF